MHDNRIWKEFWETIEINFEHTSDSRWEISNWGRVRGFTKTSNGKILSGSITGGYKVIRLKLYRPRTSNAQQKVEELKQEISDLYKNRREKIKSHEYSGNIQQITLIIEQKKLALSNKLERN